MAACSFAVPVAFLLFALVREQSNAIDFAAKEAQGAAYLGELAAVQGPIALMVLGGAMPPGLPDQLAAIETRHGAGLQTAVMSTLAVAALKKTDHLQAARGRLRALIVRVGDKSNIIVDNVLESYYLGDVVLNRRAPQSAGHRPHR